MFDYNMRLLDGSVDLNASTDTAPSSTTRDASTGAAVIDLGPGGTPAEGLVAALIVPDDVNGATDTLTAFIEVSDVAAFSSDVHEMGKFDKLATGKGIIVGSEVPCTALIHFATAKRYVRLNATVGASPDDFGEVKCYLSPYPFPRL